MNAIVVGAGATAVELGARLRDAGSSVIFIATDREAAESLADVFPNALVLLGTGTYETALRQARPERCDILFSVGPDDNHALVASLLARERFGIQRVVALTASAEDLPAFEALSIESICVPIVLAEALLQAVTADVCS